MRFWQHTQRCAASSERLCVRASPTCGYAKTHANNETAASHSLLVDPHSDSKYPVLVVGSRARNNRSMNSNHITRTVSFLAWIVPRMNTNLDGTEYAYIGHVDSSEGDAVSCVFAPSLSPSTYLRTTKQGDAPLNEGCNLKIKPTQQGGNVRNLEPRDSLPIHVHSRALGRTREDGGGQHVAVAPHALVPPLG